ncbi:PD40 domain-containing protein [bacterium]|nr:PD40 domain-containing protein [bacterium]
MAKKVIGFVIAIIVILPMLGGTCQSTYIPDRGNSRPYNSHASGAEEATSMVRITSRPSHECSPDISPLGDYIAIESWEAGDFYSKAGDFDIWIVGSDGTGGFSRITNSPTDDFYASWFPDGSRILYTSLSGGYPTIWAKSATGLSGSQKISWTGTYDYTGDINPNCSSIVFSRGEQFIPSPVQICSHFFYPAVPWQKTDETLWLPRIYKMDISGARVTDLGPGFDPQISPDGNKIIYTSFKSGTYDIWMMDINGKVSTQLTTYPGHEIDPCWSPDGKWIAYSKSAPYAADGFTDYRNAEYWNIWIINVETGENFQKTFSQVARDLGPAWGYVKDGEVYRDFIYFHSDRDDFISTGFDIYRINPDMGIGDYDIPDLTSLHGAKAINIDFTESSIRKGAGLEPRVIVLNSTENKGWAKEVGDGLRDRGYNIVEVGNTVTEKNLQFTKIYYRDGFRLEAGVIALKKMTGTQYIYLNDEISDADIVVALGGNKASQKVTDSAK